jgi:zinc transport system substrate-binding protein
VTGRGAGTGETGAIVYTVNYPLAYFAGRIGGDHVNVNFPAPAGADPAEWSPSPETISRYQQADRVLLNGAGYAAWTARATLPAGKLVDTSAAFRDDYLYIEDAPTHTHGPSGDHTHRNLAATTWLDPVLAIEQARAVRDAFVKTWPRFEAEFDAGFKSVAADLKALDGEFGALFEQEGDQPLLFSHPVYEYFVRRFELDARFLHWEPDQPLTDADLDELAEILSTHAANLMIWEREPLPATRETLDRLGVASVVFKTGAATPAEGDYLALMRRNLDRLQGAL